MTAPASGLPVAASATVIEAVTFHSREMPSLDKVISRATVGWAGRSLIVTCAAAELFDESSSATP